MLLLGRARATEAKEAALNARSTATFAEEKVCAIEPPTRSERSPSRISWEPGTDEELAEDAWLRDSINLFGFGRGRPFWCAQKRPATQAIQLVPVEEGGGVTGGAVLCDETTVLDIATTFVLRRFGLTSFNFFISCITILVFVGMPGAVILGLISAPLAILSFTNTTTILFGSATSSATTAVNNSSLLLSQEARPWAVGWEQGSVAVSDVTCVFLSVMWAWIMLNLSHPGMARRICRREWTKIVITAGTAIAYTITVGTLQPHRSHLLYLFFYKVVCAVLFCFYDALMAGNRVRMSPDVFSLVYGGGGKRGWWVRIVVGSFMVMFVLDIVRHYLVVEISEDTTLVTINITNPYTDQPVVVDNRTLATALYWTSTMFLLESLWAILSGKVGRETVHQWTNYEIRVVKPPRAATLPSLTPQL
jgi:hypothetical protein